MREATDENECRGWTPARVRIGVVLWSSFIAACLATLFFFALFDPLLFAQDAHSPQWLADRMTGYAIGFFFFWSVAAVSSLIATALLLTRAPAEAAHRDRR